MPKTALFYCSASDVIDPEFNDVAREVVRAVCAHGYDVCSGGTVKGTMRPVSEEAAACGVRVKGVLPRFMKGIQSPCLTETVWTDTMAERKTAMRQGVSLCIALPGGIGTLDELVETYTLVKMGLCGAKVIAFDWKGFYAPLRELLDHYVRTGMLDAASRELIHFPATVAELEELI